MTLDERMDSLRAGWSILPPKKLLCLAETPNRLWPYDGHTSQLPFFNWLPDEIAFQFAQFSPRPTLKERFREITPASMLSFRREGRGLSFHELDLALGEYRIAGDQTAYLSTHNPIKFVKRVLARDGAKERFLNSLAPRRARALFHQNLDVVIEK
jgi:S-adenosylmethionine-dependent methyltransferase